MTEHRELHRCLHIARNALTVARARIDLTSRRIDRGTAGLAEVSRSLGVAGEQLQRLTDAIDGIDRELAPRAARMTPPGRGSPGGESSGGGRATAATSVEESASDDDSAPDARASIALARQRVVDLERHARQSWGALESSRMLLARGAPSTREAVIRLRTRRRPGAA